MSLSICIPSPDHSQNAVDNKIGGVYADGILNLDGLEDDGAADEDTKNAYV